MIAVRATELDHAPGRLLVLVGPGLPQGDPRPCPPHGGARRELQALLGRLGLVAVPGRLLVVGDERAPHRRAHQRDRVLRVRVDARDREDGFGRGVEQLPDLTHHQETRPFEVQDPQRGVGVAGLRGPRECDPQYPIALVCAAMRCSFVADYERAARYCDEAEAMSNACSSRRAPPCGGRGRGSPWGRPGPTSTRRLPGAWSSSVARTAITVSWRCRWAGRAMSRALRGEDLGEAIAEVDEALEIARRLGAPTLLVSVLAFSSFVLADVRPDRARVLMEEAVRIKELKPVRAPLYSVAGDVAERLGERRLALEYFTLGMDEMGWMGSAEMVGRMLQRIGLLIAHDEPDNGALITGSGAAGAPSGTR